jgi:hypothetical protein
VRIAIKQPQATITNAALVPLAGAVVVAIVSPLVAPAAMLRGGGCCPQYGLFLDRQIDRGGQ